MYRGLKAWFSQSVDSSLVYIWESEDGVITSHSHASYLFSSDASHHDTQRIYNSLDYVENKATIFHASFLKANIRSKGKSIPLGHFILPPACLHEEIRRAIGCFIWEQEDTPITPNVPNWEQDVQTRCADENDLQCSEHEGRDEVLISDSEPSDDGVCHTLQNYPLNNMCTGYISINRLEKFSGELHDFTPDSEHFVFCTHATSKNFYRIRDDLKKKLN
ncbi:telomere repeats-binding bouquet formation protein 2 [Gastrophryne carolinensis]